MKNLWKSLKASLGVNRIDQKNLKALELILLKADFGTSLSGIIIEAWQEILENNSQHAEEEIKEALKKVLSVYIEGPATDLTPGQFITLWGVNGVGKTTTTAKLAYRLQQQGHTVMLAACDTFRAAANAQLKIWAQRLDCPIVSQEHNADPASVAFDALQAQTSRKIDFCIADTAGRIHHNVSLQQQSQKILRVLKKLNTEAPHHRFLVLDAHLGQNSLEQARHFNEALELTGIIVSKWDGNAKAGFLAQIAYELHLPIYFIGTGESLEDLELFSLQKYIDKIMA